MPLLVNNSLMRDQTSHQPYSKGVYTVSFNLIDLIKDQMNDPVMDQLAEVLGGSAEQNSSAIDSAIPGLLGGLMKSGLSPIGSNTLLEAIKDQDDSILDNFGTLLSGNKQSAMMNTGSNILGSQLGANGFGSLINAVADFSGVGKDSAKSLLGLLTPMILNLIKRKLLSGDGLNLSNLTHLFNSQKNNIATSMPIGFQQQLDSFGFTNNIASNAKDLTQTITIESSSLLNKLFPAALVLATLLLAYNLFFANNIDPQTLEGRNNTPEQTSINKQLSGVMNNVTNSLERIKDTESAEATLPQLEEAISKLESIASLMDRLPSVQEPASIIVTEGLPKISETLNKANAIPGVGPVLKPISDTLLEKLALFQR